MISTPPGYSYMLFKQFTHFTEEENKISLRSVTPVYYEMARLISFSNPYPYAARDLDYRFTYQVWESCFKQLALCQEKGDSYDLAHLYHLVGFCLESFENFPPAAKYYRKASQLWKSFYLEKKDDATLKKEYKKCIRRECRLFQRLENLDKEIELLRDYMYTEKGPDVALFTEILRYAGDYAEVIKSIKLFCSWLESFRENRERYEEVANINIDFYWIAASWSFNEDRAVNLFLVILKMSRQLYRESPKEIYLQKYMKAAKEICTKIVDRHEIPQLKDPDIAYLCTHGPPKTLEVAQAAIMMDLENSYISVDVVSALSVLPQTGAVRVDAIREISDIESYIAHSDSEETKES